MRKSIFPAGFDMLMKASTVSDSFSDAEIRELRPMDMYGTPVRFGDPTLFIHCPKDVFKRRKDIEFVIAMSNIKTTLLKMVGQTDNGRTPNIKTLFRVFSDMHVLSHSNIQRASNDIDIIYVAYNHIIARRRR